jgi:mannosyltransferase OCH1-like enzyme
MAKKKAVSRRSIAKVSQARGKYFLTVSGKKVELTGVSKAQIRSAVGKPVDPILYKKAVVAIQWKPGPGILCYVPGPDILNKVAPEIQRTLLKAFVDKGIITAEQGREIVGGG